MFCRNCGKPIDPNAAVCINCGFSNGTGDNHCPNCGNATNVGMTILYDVRRESDASKTYGGTEIKTGRRVAGDFSWIIRCA